MTALFDKRLIVVSGKGGVGKSAISAALALRFARRGEKTLVCEVNTRERIPGFLGHSARGTEVLQLEKNLHWVMVRPDEAMREYALMKLRFETVYKAVFENRVVRYFLRFVPSLAELVMLGKILFHLQEEENGKPKWDRIVVDAPATGHAITFLNVPQVILDTVPPGPLQKEAKVMRDLLVDPAVTGAVLVSLPEEMPVNETIDLAGELRSKVRVTPVATVLNYAFPERFSDLDLSALSPRPELLHVARAQHDRFLQTRSAHAQLAEKVGVPVVDVPRLFIKQFDRAAIEEIAAVLGQAGEA